MHSSFFSNDNLLSSLDLYSHVFEICFYHSCFDQFKVENVKLIEGKQNKNILSYKKKLNCVRGSSVQIVLAGCSGEEMERTCNAS